MNKAPISSLNRLLTEFRSWQEQRQDSQYAELKSGLERMKSGLDDLQRAARKDERSHARGFNIFRLLGVEHDEVKTHSPLLHTLLSPDGNPGRKSFRCAWAFHGLMNLITGTSSSS